MLDTEIKFATCMVNCGEISGTGWLITSKVVMTAVHCIEDAIDDNSPVHVSFGFHVSSLKMKAQVIAYDSKLDISLLLLEKECEFPPIHLNDILPLDGSRYYSYGWPAIKLTIGHRLEGTVIQIFDSPKLGSDIEVSIDSPASLSNYKGFSGAALICDGACVGVIRISIENTLGVISISKLRDFLREHGIAIESFKDEEQIEQELASREVFTKQFDTLASTQASGYLFIEGAHGIGKSTFCNTYKPVESSLEHFGTYSFTPTKGAANAVQLAQPQEFFNWLNMRVSMLLTNSPGRIDKKDYLRLIKETNELLVRLGDEYSYRGKIGLLFIDGLDEVSRQDNEILTQFIGLLPQRMPTGLTIIFAAPNYDQFATRLGAKLSRDSCISMPVLSDSAVHDFCFRTLIAERSNSKIINLICERAQGHPLYLRYLIDLVNSGTDDSELAALPLIEGSIRKYYDSLWHQLQQDNDAVNLLAIAVRLRWGIPIKQFAEILNQGEQAILVGTIGRIQHLLLEPDETTIYHSSFSEYLIEKTQLREQDIQLRLAEYCESHKNNRYGLLNLVYHGLRVMSSNKAHPVALCNQKWVDACVLEGGRPDTILDDLNKVLIAATELGDLVETVRILLLSQRIKFRYNTLFAQSADLTANALISIEKSHEVLQHVIRYNQLIIPIDQALKVALKLVQNNNSQDAFELLRVIEALLTEQLEQVSNEGGLSFIDFLGLYEFQLQQYLIKIHAGDKNADLTLNRFQFYWMNVVDSCAENEELSKAIRSQMLTFMLAANMCLHGRYISISQIKKFYSGPINTLVEPLVFSVSLYRELCDDYCISHNKGLLEEVFSDLKLIISVGLGKETKVHISAVNNLIALGASREIILALDVDKDELSPICFIADDDVSIDESALYDGMARWRYEAFFDDKFYCPPLVPLSSTEWIGGVDSICRLIAWCDGSARRLRETNDKAGLNAVWKILQQNIFVQLRFSLSDRIQWEDAYSLPEVIFPHIYQYLTTLIVNIFPNHICDLLTFIEEQFSSQCGVYSEGFRKILSKVLLSVTSEVLGGDTEDQAFQLAEHWREYVTSDLKNRYELVPELLEIIPLFTRLDASEEAIKTYQFVLAFSMGPSWYKEDQLGLSITALESLNHSSTLESGVLSQITGLLDAAGGEMTFQRFVRYAKRDLIRALCLRGDFGSAVDYFIRQTYGTLKQMYDEVTLGEIDRISELKGTRFPGAALDEQDSILCLVESVIPNSDWQLCWALLESFQFGDSRHLNNYAKAYGLLIQKAESDSNAFSMMMDRLEIISESEFESDCTKRSEFLATIGSYVPDSIKNTFETRFSKLLFMQKTHANKIECFEAPYPSVDLEPLDNENKRIDSDSLYLAGIFGCQSSIDKASATLSKAKSSIRRRNYKEAQRLVISSLDAIQRGGWSIWNDGLSEVSDGKHLLSETESSVSDLVKLFSPLIENERFAESWLIAENLIAWLANRSSSDEQAELLRLTIEHTSLMVGNAEEEISSYKYLEKESETELHQYLANLLLHVIDHPTWLRSEKSAEMLAWLATSYPKFIHLFGARAFSLNSCIHPDIICGALEQYPHAQLLWDQLAKELNFSAIMQSCKHVGRYSVLVRIARQAAVRDFDHASDTLSLLRESFSSVVEVSTENDVELPLWAKSVAPSWAKLKILGLVDSNLIHRATLLMEEICSPLSIETSLEIEQLLAEGYSGNAKHPHRWTAKVRYVFQVASQSIANESTASQIEVFFRKYNPTCLDNLRIKGFDSPALQWLQSNEPRPLHGNSIYLDYCERVWFEGKLRLVRLTAYFYEDGETFPLPSGRFLSTEKPTLDKTSNNDVCVNVDIYPAYFGGFTPAIPTTNFMRFTGATSSDLNRSWWKSGRRLNDDYFGAPLHEGCFLSIDKDSLRLPRGLNLVWVYELDLKPIRLISLR